MQTETINLQGKSFDEVLKRLITLGALFICTSSTLATHQFLMRYWSILFYIGCTIVVLGTGISILRNQMKRSGYISADEQERQENLNPYFFKGKRLAG